MEIPRFYRFITLIEGIHKSVNRLKFGTAPDLGVKSVHLFWIYELYVHPNGLTAAELASASMVSRSLISREIETLQEDGYIEIRETSKGKRKNYNSPITLTQKGKKLAHEISTRGTDIQAKVNRGISENDLDIFYRTLDRLLHNLAIATKEYEASNDDIPASNDL